MAQTQRWWRVGELAVATGLTVRTFHHYDHIGLLTPTRRSDGGHRLYTADDISRLSLIIVLRRAGIALTEIKNLLDQDTVDLAALIDQQTQTLETALIDTVAFGRELQRTTGVHAVCEPEQIRSLLSWAPSQQITYQPIVVLVYRDVERAHDRLIDMFGFGPGYIARHDDGTAHHAVVTGPTGNVHLHEVRPGLAAPHPTADPSSITVVGVADVAAHRDHARRAGALIIEATSPVHATPDEYAAFDHEHHFWRFRQQARG